MNGYERIIFPVPQINMLFNICRMKKDGYKSPNMADALIMAVSVIDEVIVNQKNAYGAVRQRPRQSDNLFEIAGVR